MAYFCNPVDSTYPYQFIVNPHTGAVTVNREAADPSVICFQGRYWMFASMTLSVWVSDDLARWECHRLPEELPLYGYAPDACVADEWGYFTASHIDKKCVFFRTKDILNGPYERLDTEMCYHDPHLFYDDGRFYFYWGCSDTEPIRGVELDQDLKPIGTPVELISSDPYEKGYERVGEDNSLMPRTKEQIDGILSAQGMNVDVMEPDFRKMVESILGQRPYIEGPWMTKHNGKYYLQYAFGGAHFNIYGDGTYVSESPLGPFSLAENNPYAFQPGGFLPGAGHGSTFQDRHGNWWHAGTMRISVNHNFERRVGLWPAGFDDDGELFCNTAYGDWPRQIPLGKTDPWKAPDVFLLSYGKNASASSGAPEKAVDENAQTWWKSFTNQKEEWLQIDLGQIYSAAFVQVNFADDFEAREVPGKMCNGRYIEQRNLAVRYLLEGSADGEHWEVLADTRESFEDRPHKLHSVDKKIRYVRISQMELPYRQNPCISGLRVFGKGVGEKPVPATFQACRNGTDLHVTIDSNAIGYNILWGHSPDKLYHSCMVFGKDKKIGGLVKNQNCFIRVDAFNENGITCGCVKKVDDYEN